MRKRVLLVVFFIALCILYLFYRSCRRDTVFITPADRITLPDSAWLYGSINFKQIRKDIAWSTILNGDFSKIFQTDTSNNTLLKILRSPDQYLITEQDNIRYFSVWKDSLNYNGLLFALKNNDALKQSFKSDSFLLKQKTVYSFRTSEGFWLYNSSNLLFISGPADSLVACTFFSAKNNLHSSAISDHTTDTVSENTSSAAVIISCRINTLFVPQAMKHALQDSTLIDIRVLSNDAMLDIKYTYTGFLTEALNQSSITHLNTEAAVFCVANLNIKGFTHILEKMPSLQQAYLKQKTNIAPVLSAMDNNNLTIEFNGWNKIKSSYYASVMNEEFELVLQKKDSTIIEPVFHILLEQKSKIAAQAFLTYLQKEGIVSKGTKQPFSITYGNFDSELKLNETNQFTVYNKHNTVHTATAGPEPLDAALLLEINPAALKGLMDPKIPKPIVFRKFETYKKIDRVLLHVQKEEKYLRGTLKIKFSGKSHPIIALMETLKEITYFSKE